MNEARLTPLISRAILNRTSQVFPEETHAVCASTNLMRRVTNLNPLEKSSGNRDLHGAIQLLFSRNRELAHFSVVCLFNGGYASVKVLVRAATENALCMRLFNKRPELATKWIKNPERFRRKWNPTQIIRDVFATKERIGRSYRQFYGILCSYVHPSSLGWREQIVDSKILWRPIFKPENASECFGQVFFIIMQSFKPFFETCQQRIPLDVLSHVNVILPRVEQMIMRHFQVIGYTTEVKP